MKKLVIILLATVIFAPCANAINVLMENQKFKQELDTTTSRQYVENKNHIKYYRGMPSYIGGRSTSLADKKVTFKKKGVKFKLSEKEKAELKAKQEQEEKMQAQTQTEEVKTETSVKKQDNHNADAE